MIRLAITATALLAILCLHTAAIWKAGSGSGRIGSPVGGGAGCTDGVDCYADRVLGGDLNDPDVLIVEDWEDSAYYAAGGVEGVTVGDPNGGPWYDDQSGERGDNSRWDFTWGISGTDELIADGNPSGTPFFGTACADQGSDGRCGMREYCSAQQNLLNAASPDLVGTLDGTSNGCWGSPTDDTPNTNSCLDFQRAGDCDDELPGLGCPPEPIDNGRQWFAFRNAAIDGKPCGFMADEGKRGSLGSPRTEVGVTIAYAFPDNVFDADILGASWKFTEWGPTKRFTFPVATTGCDSDSTAFPAERFPFCISIPYDDQAACEDAVNNTRWDPASQFGQIACSNRTMKIEADPNLYQRSTDWVMGDWNCVQGYVQGYGTSTMRIRVWNAGELVFDVIDLDNSGNTAGGLTNYHLNNFSNKNQAVDGDTTTETTYRYTDNLHIREGAPVSCSQLGQKFAAVPDIVL